MKVFIWDNVEALRDYAPGTVIAVAESKGQAISLVEKMFKGKEPASEGFPQQNPFDLMKWADKISLTDELWRTEPEVAEPPYAIAQKGSA